LLGAAAGVRVRHARVPKGTPSAMNSDVATTRLP
jgi:hypothetical protein